MALLRPFAALFLLGCSAATAAAEVKVTRLPFAARDFAFDAHSGDLAAVNQSDKLLVVFPRGYFGEKREPANDPVSLDFEPDWVEYKRWNGKLFLIIREREGRGLQLFDGTTRKHLAKITALPTEARAG